MTEVISLWSGLFSAPTELLNNSYEGTVVSWRAQEGYMNTVLTLGWLPQVPVEVKFN